MYDIEFYANEQGKEPVKEFIEELHRQAAVSKNGRINFTKIMAYINALAIKGTRIGEPMTKHLDGDIWELRPLSNRVLYAYCKGNKFILLHCFVKKTQKTPVREIEQAKRNLKNYIERNK